MKKSWELAKYLIDAKKCVDALIYIEKNKKRLSNLKIREIVDDFRQKFYINLGVVLDSVYNKSKKQELYFEDDIAERIYYERDKNAAHKDADYKPRQYKNISDEINDKKLEISHVKKLCERVLPKELTLDFVPHDFDLFRQVHRIDVKIEKGLNLIKYPKGQCHSYQISEEGLHFFYLFKSEEENRKKAKLLNYDYDKTISKNIIESAEDIKNYTEEEKENAAVLFVNGINCYEGVQNRQDSCIKANLLYDYLNLWVRADWKNIDRFEKLRELGFLDDFDIPHMESLDGENGEKIKGILSTNE